MSSIRRWLSICICINSRVACIWQWHINLCESFYTLLAVMLLGTSELKACLCCAEIFDVGTSHFTLVSLGEARQLRKKKTFEVSALR